jgi:hypothetical protein
MEEPFQMLTRRQERRGEFDGYKVSGFQFENPNGQLVWQINAGTGTGPVGCYWILNRKFHDVRIHFVRDENQYEIGAELNDVPTNEKKAILKAITEWEEPVEINVK